MKRLNKAVLFLRIEWNWRLILHYRKRIKPLLAGGIPKVETQEYQKILRLDEKNSKYCGKVISLTEEFLRSAPYKKVVCYK